MSINTIKFESYAQSVDEITGMLKRRVVDLSVRHVLIVPDVYTFTLEKRLFLDGKGAFDLEVTTFARLQSRIGSCGERLLGKQGALMILKRICRELSPKLKYYARSSMKAGFAEKLYDALNKLRASGITPERLAEAGDAHKAADIAMLYAEYMRRTAGVFVDSAGRLELLRRAVEGGALGDCHVYVALYDFYPAEIRKVLAAIGEHALSLTVCEVLPPVGEKTTAAVRAVGCPEIVSAYKVAAKAIRAFVMSGRGGYDDVCVVDETDSAAVAKRIFDEYGIPHYIKQRSALGKTELARFVLGALGSARLKTKRDDAIALAENYYMGCEKSDVCMFIDFVSARYADIVDLSAPFRPTALTDEETLAGAERVRVRMSEVLSAVGGRATGGSALAARLKRLLDLVGAEAKTRELSEKCGDDITAVYEKTVELLDLFGELAGDDPTGVDALADILKEGFAGTFISPLPNETGTVQVGPLSQFRGERAKYAVIVGFNEGVLPAVSPDTGLLTDEDAERLVGYGLKLEPGTAVRNALCHDELWHFFGAAGDVLAIYCEGGGAKPSCELKLLEDANGVTPISYEKFRTSVPKDANAVARWLGSYSGALEALLNGDAGPVSGSVREAVADKYAYLFEKKQPLSSGVDRKKLFFPGGTTSVSAIQSYFRCPYAYFLRYGLRLKTAEDGKVTPIDLGNLLHETVELYVDRGMPADVERFVEDTIAELVAKHEKYGYAENERALARAKKEAVKLCGIAAAQIAAGKFRPYGAETFFGRDGGLKTVELGRGVRLIGGIDRIDVYRDYARVIDYKTGNASFAYSDLYYGLKIQTLMYLRVLTNNGFRPAGAFYFPFAVNFTDTEYSHVLNGPYVGTDDLLCAFDEALASPGKSTVINATVKQSKDDATPSLKANAYATDEEGMRALSEYALLLARGAVKEILAGNAAPSPFAEKRRCACNECDYRSVCGEERIKRPIANVGRDEVTDAVRAACVENIGGAESRADGEGRDA